MADERPFHLKKWVMVMVDCDGFDDSDDDSDDFGGAKNGKRRDR